MTKCDCGHTSAVGVGFQGKTWCPACLTPILQEIHDQEMQIAQWEAKREELRGEQPALQGKQTDADQVLRGAQRALEEAQKAFEEADGNLLQNINTIDKVEGALAALRKKLGIE